MDKYDVDQCPGGHGGGRKGPVMGGRQARRLIFLAIASLAVLLAWASAAVAQPTPTPSTPWTVASNFLDRVVWITMRQGAGQSDVTGYGIVVGEHIDRTGRQVFVVVTADHVVGGTNDAGRAVPPPQLTVKYCADRSHTWDATLLDFRVPPGKGDLAVLEVPRPPGYSTKPAAMAPGLTPPAGSAALNIGFPPGGCLTPVVPGQYIGLLDGIWLGFAGLTTPPGSSGGPVVTAEGLVGMVIQDGGFGNPSRALPIEVIASNVKGSGTPLGYRRRSAGIQCEPDCLHVRRTGNQACAGPVRVIRNGHSDGCDSLNRRWFSSQRRVEFRQPARDIRTLRQHDGQADPLRPRERRRLSDGSPLDRLSLRRHGCHERFDPRSDRDELGCPNHRREGSPATATIALLAAAAAVAHRPFGKHR